MNPVESGGTGALLPEVAITLTHAPEGTVIVAPRGLHMMDPEAYACDLFAMTCECEEFETRLVDFPLDSPLRCCKHLRFLLLNGGLVTIGESDAEGLWFERGGRIFKWQAPTGKVVYFSVDPTREWINVAPVRKRAGTDARIHGWSVVDRRWAHGQSPYGLSEVIEVPLSKLSSVHAGMQRDLGADVAQRWAARTTEHAQRVRERKEAAEDVAREQGILCDICAHPVGMPWGTTIGTEVQCPQCGVALLADGDKSADFTERVRLTWRFEGAPWPGQPKGLLQMAREEHDGQLEAMRAELRSNTRTWEQFQSDGSAVETAYRAKVKELERDYRDALRPIAARIGAIRRRLTREAKRAPR